MSRISVAEPCLKGNERKYVMDCLDSNWISSNGKYIHAFEELFANFCNVKHAITTNNGTTALHLALVAMNLQPGDEVIIPTVTYIATANAVKYCNAKPVFVDVCPNTLTIDPEKIKEKITARTRGIIPVHLYGHPANMTEIKKIAQTYHLWILEDAAEAHGAQVENTMVGSLGDCAIFSFFGNKIITTGEGGMITTNHDHLAEKLRLLRGQGMDPQRRYWFPVVGYNYRMTNIQAAIGLAQMEQIDQALAYRQTLATWYNEQLQALKSDIFIPEIQPWAKHVFWMYTIYLRHSNESKRDIVIKYLESVGIETRPVFYPMHCLPPYYEDNASYPIANEWAFTGINLPTHQGLSLIDIEKITYHLAEAIHNL